MSFNVAIVYEHIAKAMAASSDSARDNGQWKQLCLDVMRTFRTLPGNSAMSREILDDMMTAIRKAMDKEAEEQGLESTFRSALSTTRVSTISEGDVHLISEDADGSRTGSADGSRTGSSELSSSRTGSRLMENTWEQGPGDDGEEDETEDFYVQYINRQSFARNCSCGVPMRWGTDYCGACKSFRPNTQICTSCGAPRAFSDTATEHCRNYGSHMACGNNSFRAPDVKDHARAALGCKQRAILDAERKARYDGGAASRGDMTQAIVPRPQPPQFSQKQKGKGGGRQGTSGAIVSKRTNMISSTASVSSGNAERIYNKYGFDNRGRAGDGSGRTTSDPAALVGAFRFSRAYLDERGLDNYG